MGGQVSAVKLSVSSVATGKLLARDAVIIGIQPVWVTQISLQLGLSLLLGGEVGAVEILRGSCRLVGGRTGALARYASFAESPLTGEISNNRITVTAEPWVSPEDVRKQCESLRRAWLYTETPFERRVELVDFVAGFCEGYYNEERGVSGLLRGSNWSGWRHIMEQWNQRYPQEHDWHCTDVRNFSRDFRDTFKTLTSYQDF